MKQQWSLEALYPSFEAEEFVKDMERCRKEIMETKDWVDLDTKTYDNAAVKIETYITRQNSFFHLFSRLMGFAQLSVSTDAKHKKALQTIEKLEDMSSELAGPTVTFQKWLGSLASLEDIISSSYLLKAHKHHLTETANRTRYLLSESEEVLLAKMQNTGSSAWSKLQELLTSTLLVDIQIDGQEKQLPLSVVRNMAYEKNEELRRNAYEAELSAYRKIEESSAACLNGIKGEVITITKARGYDSPLHKTLLDSRMDKETLEAMLSAMKESLPVFHRFFRKKGERLGHRNGLPFYDLFAPIGEVDMRFTYEDAKDFIVKQFSSFSQKLGDYAEHAFQNQWIDAEPREGKRGGAFCYNLHVIKESRILANFTGSFNDMSTLAHELGHGYHGQLLTEESYLNSEYPMPLAETASIFCETIITQAALKTASPQERLVIMENELSDAAQVIVDIYSRYLFETELFAKRAEGSLSAQELNEIMLEAQREAYGDGLDPNFLHPNMWTCKPHYYYAEENFYNFPYAFGLLFAKGLYAEYQKRGDEFVKQYDHLLSVTGKMSIADAAQLMNVDVRSVDFWRSSLQSIEKNVEAFLEM
jgi:pepF/M3 family oligoendopeptidase